MRIRTLRHQALNPNKMCRHITSLFQGTPNKTWQQANKKGPEGAFLFVPADTTSKKRLALFDRLVFASLHARLVCGADDALAAYQFLETVGSPTCHTRAGKQRSDHILRNAHHGVHESRIHINVCAHILLGALFLQDDFRA